MRASYLKPHDIIAIAAPAHKVSEQDIMPSIDLIKKEGYRILLAPHLFESHHQYAGKDEIRAADMQELLENPEVKAILCARGGYGSVRIIDSIDFSPLREFPKWICGYSDITAFHSHLFTHLQLATIHCTMPINIKKAHANQSFLSMIQALRGDDLLFNTPTHPLNRPGTASGKIIGGNLSIIYSLLGSSSDINTENAILFIEDLDEYLYHIDRMMMNLKRNGKLEKISALLVGGLTKMHDNDTPYGKTAEEIISEHCRGYQFPICFNFPAGHIENNLAIRFGMNAKLTVNGTGTLHIFS